MSIPQIQNGVQLLNTLAAQAKGPSASPQATQSAALGGFAAELQASLHKVNSLQQNASTKAKAFQMGDPDVALNDVMVDMQKAGIAFQFVTQVRNKVISAYKDISNMPV